MLEDKEGTSCVMGRLELRFFLPLFCPQLPVCWFRVVLGLSLHWAHLPKVLKHEMC